MNSITFPFRARRSAVALAVGLVVGFACLGAHAQGAKVDASVSVGVAAVDGGSADRAHFDHYSGLQNNSVVGLLGIDYSLRDEGAGKWVDLTGSNLLGESRELNFVWKNPGLWKFNANYGELVQQDPNTVNTGLLGIGSTQPTVQVVAPGFGNNLNLQTKRTGLGLGFTRIISPAWQVAVDVKTENKDGARLSGAYLNCITLTSANCTALGAGLLPVTLLPEPIKSNHTQVETRLSYGADKLRLSLGYYGSFYRNSNAALDPSGAGVAAALLALPPDNEAHQFDLSGSYDINPTTRGTLKLGYATALQRASFVGAGAGVNAGVGTNLDALVITSSAKLGLSARPMPKLSLLADLNYQNKDDQTPLLNYNLVGTNRQLPNTKVHSKAQASWQFSRDYRGTVGADYEFIDRGTFTASSIVSGVNALRQQTAETTLHANLKRQLANNVSGSVGFSSSRRNGSNWLVPNVTGIPGIYDVTNPAVTFAATPGAVFMPTLADRQRDKFKLAADWQASEQLSLQFNAETGTDSFTTPTVYGLRDSRMSLLGVDWSYTLSDNWAMTGYLAQSTQTLNQARYAGTVMAVDNTNLAASIGMTGKANAKWQVGASLAYVDDKNSYAQSPDASAAASVATQLATSGGLPDTSYRQTALKLFANYALEKKSSLRFDLIHQRTSVNDWAWASNGVPFVYADGSTVTQSADQNVSFIGVTYVYQLR
ncbi:MAG: MtrB/PioB family decaheme-associated outer membrane protein [Rhodoferax sp.]|nr:MtrB/PioB family decaheme-associated outer membrane protein [Rhodoferax sp.]